MNNKFISVSIFSLTWAINIIINRYLLNQHITPLSLNFITMGISSSIFLIYIHSFRKISLLPTTKKHWGALLSGVIGGGLANIFGVYGIQLSTATNYGFLVKLATVFNVVFAYFLLKEPITKMKAALILIMMSGAYLLSTNGQRLDPHIGDILIITTGALYALSAVLNRKLIKKALHPDIVSLYRSTAGFLLVTLAILFFEPLQLLPQVGTNTWIWLIVSGIFGALTVFYLNQTLKIASASYMTMMSMSVPVMVALIAMPLFGDKLSPIQWLGGSLIVAGGILTEIKKVAHHE